MKSKWLLLTKIQLMGMLDFNKSRYAKDAKLTRRTAGSFAIIAIIALVICVYSVIISIGFCEQGIGAHLPAFLIAVTSLVTLMFSLMQGCSPLFAMKDYDHVMTLPVKKSEILASRLVCIYLSNLLFALPVVIPGTIVLFRNNSVVRGRRIFLCNPRCYFGCNYPVAAFTHGCCHYFKCAAYSING